MMYLSKQARSVVASACALAVTAMACVSGCRSESKPAVYVFLFDASGSASNDERARYRAEFKGLVEPASDKNVERLQTPASVTWALISGQSLGSNISGGAEHYPAWAGSNVDDFRREWKQRSERLVQHVTEAMDKASRSQLSKNHTEIVDALDIAVQAFAKQPKARHLLVIFSDMLEQSDRFDLTAGQLSDKEIAAIIAREKSGGRLPDLANAEVYVVGPEERSSERYLRVRTFWQRYFAAAGAKLDASNYGSGLPTPR